MAYQASARSSGGTPPTVSRSELRSYRPSWLASTIWRIVGGKTYAEVHRSRSIRRQISSVSAFGMITLVPPQWKIPNVLRSTPMWNIGPALR
jgi:hypothetical protein